MISTGENHENSVSAKGNIHSTSTTSKGPSEKILADSLISPKDSKLALVFWTFLGVTLDF